MVSPVTGEAREALETYTLLIRDRMRLQQWDIHVTDEPADDGASLDIKPNVRLMYARLRVGTFFDNSSLYVNNRDERRRAVVHEMFHLYQAPLLHWLQKGTWQTPLAPDQAQTIEDTVYHELEVQAEMAARLIAPTMPYGPEEWDAKTA